MSDSKTTPAPTEILYFIQVFDRLSLFEAQSRHVRGYGAFGPDTPLPIPEVITVLDWLKGQAT